MVRITLVDEGCFIGQEARMPGGNADLEGRVAVVTGAAIGIGRAIAEGLADEGAAVVLADITDDVEAKAEELASSGRKAVGVNLDVRDRSSMRDCVAAAVKSFGRLDVMINNAGW